MSIAKSITELRTASGMSQQSLADALYVSRDLVSKWERGLRRPDYRMIEKISEVFNVSPDAIIDKKNFIYSELTECFSGGEDLSEEKLTNILNAFLRKQTAKNADVFVKRYYFMKSVTEISDEYGIGENHVRSILSKMRKRLKKYLGKDRT